MRSAGLTAGLDAKAGLASPALTGVPTGPTATAGTNTTQLATTAFVRGEVGGLVGAAPPALDTLGEIAAAIGNDPTYAATVANALAGKQPLDAELTAIAGLASAADRLPYFTGAGLHRWRRSRPPGAHSSTIADAAAQRATLGLGSIADAGCGTLCRDLRAARSPA